MSTVTRNDERSRYELEQDGRVVGVCDFQDAGATTVLPHVEVDPALQGQGLAGQLVGEALADLKARGREVRPLCPYVVDYVRRHPDAL
jgi:uncharacterized protein